MAKKNALDDFMAERSSSASYDATKVDPATVAVLNAAEDRKRDDPKGLTYDSVQQMQMADARRGVEFWERLDERFQSSEQPLRNKLEDYSMRVSRNMTIPDLAAKRL